MALLFDFGGTLDGPSHWLDRFLAQYRAAGIDITRAEVDPAFDHATRTGYRATRVLARFGLKDLVRFIVGHQVEYLRKDGPERIRSMIEASGAAGRHRMVEQVTASFVAETAAGLEHSRGVLTALKARFKLGVVSNFYGNLDRILAEFRLDRLMSAVADSSKIGIFKPELGIFEAAIAQMRVAPETIAMIGDSLGKDCAPAHRLGLHTVWLCSEGARADAENSAEVADRTIRTIDELVELKW
ncbi:MAG: HAD family hydrolase [Candidatus Binatus sp.]|uniref:HAD family hydrolase n=1 Tax=Candidatus Binatus sp. TaxID=2811406 RepID=UPI002727FC90|nr:HAD family hydrolase [Candidatus Binatus sp.]MDO8431440.1 HAD family hydrolase [Candidatus Binatus sp.]